MPTNKLKSIKTKALVEKIRESLKKEGIWKEGMIEIPKNEKKSELHILKQKIEFAILTAREFQNPDYLLPKNPVFRLIKKGLLSVLRAYTRSQIVFNKNILIALENLYRYFQFLEKNK